MRILYYAGIDLSLPQGHAVHVRRLCDAFEGRGHEVALVARAASGPLSWSGPSGGIRETRGWPIPRLRHPSAEWNAARALRFEVKRFRPHLLLARAEALTVAPLLLDRNLREPTTRRLPLVAECNGALGAFAQVGGVRPSRSSLLHALEGHLLRAADATGMVTKRLVETLVPAHGLDPRRVFVVPNGAWVPPARGADLLEPRLRRGVPNESCLLAFAGNLHPMQGLEGLFEAMAKAVERLHHDIRLWIVGESPERPALEARARALGLAERVLFLGGIPEEEAVRHLQAAQAIVAPYRSGAYGITGAAAENLKILQGLACDRPVLVGPIQGVESIEVGPAVHRVPSDTTEAWAETLVHFTRDWQSAGSLLTGWPWPEGTGPGRAWVMAHRTWDHSAGAWEPVFERAFEIAA